MIFAKPYSGQTLGIFGLGKAGEASVASLQAGGAKIFAWDDKQTAANGYLVPYADWPWSELKALVMAPGVPKTHPCGEMAKKHGVPIIGDIEILLKSQPQARTIGITGTNGKSTTTTLIGHILQAVGVRAQVGGNLGTAALSLEPLEKDGTYVIELSSYQLDLVHSTRFDIALLLNLTPDHLERHGDMAGYMAAKEHIFDRQTKDDFAIIAVDDEYTKALAAKLKKAPAQLVTVSCRDAADIYVQDGILHDGSLSFDISNISALTGEHNWQNAAIAYAAVKAHGVAPEKIVEAMRSFPGLRHRLQLVDTIGGVRFINDSKATNADATQHALKPYKNIYWIAGGMAKAGGIEPLAPLFGHVARAYLIGEAQEQFAATLEGEADHKMVETLENAVRIAAHDAAEEKKEGAVVLLSPACASFDQFKSFEHRGDVFCELVEGLKHGA